MLTWYPAGENARELQRDFIDQREGGGPWAAHEPDAEAPAGAASVRIELGLRRAERGAVYWRGVRLAEVPAPAPRLMRVATTRIVAASPPTIEANTKLMADMLERLGPEKAGLRAALGKSQHPRHVKGPLAEKAQTIPGPLTELAGREGAPVSHDVITTLLERDGNRFYNTAVLLGPRRPARRQITDKVHLTIGENGSGLTPGSEYPGGRDGPRPDRHRDVLGQLVLGADADFPAAAAARWWSSCRSPATATRRTGLRSGMRARSTTASISLRRRTVADSPSRIIDARGLGRGGIAREVSAMQSRTWTSTASGGCAISRSGSGMGEARSLYLRERRPDTYAPMCA